MQLQKVVSGTVDAIGYDQLKNSVIVQFRDGSLYEYEVVPFAIYERLLSAPSKGSFLHKMSKSFKSKRLT